jgi:hypothetical protein
MKKISAVNFFKFLVIKTLDLDPHWQKMLDPYPEPQWNQYGSATLNFLPVRPGPFGILHKADRGNRVSKKISPVRPRYSRRSPWSRQRKQGFKTFSPVQSGPSRRSPRSQQREQGFQTFSPVRPGPFGILHKADRGNRVSKHSKADRGKRVSKHYLLSDQSRQRKQGFHTFSPVLSGPSRRSPWSCKREQGFQKFVTCPIRAFRSAFYIKPTEGTGFPKIYHLSDEGLLSVLHEAGLSLQPHVLEDLEGCVSPTSNGKNVKISVREPYSKYLFRLRILHEHFCGLWDFIFYHS